MVSLVSANAGLQVSRAAAVKRAEVAARSADDLNGEADTEELRNLKRALERSKRETEEAKKEVSALKRRSESLARDYDRLMEEKDKMDQRSNLRGVFGWKKN